MKSKFIYALVIATLMVTTGCRTNNDLLMYSNDPGVYFYAGTNTTSGDTLGYNFILKPDSVKRDTIYLPLRIMGDTANRDRVVEIAVADSSTAKEGVDFEFGSKLVRAGRYSDSIELYLLRTEDLKAKIKKLYLRIVPSKDFKPGYYAFQDFRVSVTDQVVPPTWTGNHIRIFGAFSMVKFRFMVETLQRVTFGLNELTLSQMTAMATLCKLALAEHEKIHGPLLDENGQKVVFP